MTPEARLQRLVRYAAARSPFYSERLPRAFSSITDLPFLTRQQLADNLPRLTCVPREEWADVSRTSGSTGQPLYVPVNHREMRRIIRYVGEGFRATGIARGDAVMLLLPLDDLINPPAIIEPALRWDYRCLVLRVGAVAVERQMEVVRALRPAAVVGAPSPFLRLGQALLEAGVDPRSLGVRRAVLMGQPLHGIDYVPNALLRRIEAVWGAEVFSVYGSTEFYAGMAECDRHRGHHVPEEHMRFEVVDPETGAPLDDGVGELVFTSLTREALPLIRYRTGDLGWIERGPCGCGRDGARVMAVLGRADEMLKIKGSRLYPQQVEEAVLSAPGVLAHLVEVYTDAVAQDMLRVRIAASGDADEVVAEVKRRVRLQTRVTPHVEVTSVDDLERAWHADGGRKPRKFHDLRGR